VDGVCCDTACNRQCEACDAPGTAGTCAAVTGAPHGVRPACVGDASACAGACDGSSVSACAYADGSVTCRPASCDAGVATVPAACDGSGACPARQTQPCGAYVCGPTACRGDCALDGDCAAGNFCSAGVCVARLGSGTACGGANQCASGHCVAGVCCDTACDGQCQACDVTGQAGACTTVVGAPHGARPVCAGDGSACSGTCDGSSASACAFPGASVTCRPAACASGVATLPATCDGAGACPARQDASCGAYACSGVACGSGCTADADCAAGNVCLDGACGPIAATSHWLVAGSGGCSSAGKADLAPLALVLCLLPLLRRRREVRPPVTARRPRAAARTGAVALLALALATPARAQTSTTSFEAQRFQPMAGAWDILGVESAHVPGHLEKSAVLYLNYADEPLRLISAGGPSVQQPLLESQTGLDVGASLGLLGCLEASLVLPVTATQSPRTAGAIDPALGAQLATGGIGDLRFAPKARLFATSAIALALALPVTFPTGKASGYLGQDGVTGGPRAIAEYGSPGGFRAAANVGVILRSARQLLNLDVGNALAYGLGAEMPFALLRQRFSGLATLVGQASLSGGQAVEAPLELLAGVRWYAPLGLTAALGGGPGLTNGYGTPVYRLFFSLGLGPSLPSAAASPPPEPIVAAPPPPPPRPPPPQEPVVAAPPRPPPPEPVAAAPPPPPPPVQPVPVPPPAAKVVLEADRILILEQVHFATGRDVILKSSFDLLNQVASVLLANPRVTKVRVEGHTDDQGGFQHNQDLSARRARKVREFLVKSGVAAKRLESAGYGPKKPVASNATKAGRARNRRVEFVIVAQGPPSRT